MEQDSLNQNRPQADFSVPQVHVSSPGLTPAEIPVQKHPATPSMQAVEVSDVEPTASTANTGSDIEHPLAVVEAFSSHGIEYFIMLIGLAVTAVGLSSILNAIVDLIHTKSGSLVTTFLSPYGEAALIIGLPIFVYMFLRLGSREEADATYIQDSSRRRGIQITLFVSFIVTIFTLIDYVGKLLSGNQSLTSYYSAASGGSSPWWVNLLHMIVDVGIAMSIFVYYWVKLHRKNWS